MKILFISLGCDKNLVDTEFMLGKLQGASYTFTDDETEADIIISIRLLNQITIVCPSRDVLIVGSYP